MQYMPEENPSFFYFLFELSQPQQQYKVTQPQHSCWFGHENDFANPTHTNSTAASVSLRTTFIDYN